MIHAVPDRMVYDRNDTNHLISSARGKGGAPQWRFDLNRAPLERYSLRIRLAGSPWIDYLEFSPVSRNLSRPRAADNYNCIATMFTTVINEAPPLRKSVGLLLTFINDRFAVSSVENSPTETCPVDIWNRANSKRFAYDRSDDSGLSPLTLHCAPSRLRIVLLRRIAFIVRALSTAKRIAQQKSTYCFEIFPTGSRIRFYAASCARATSFDLPASTRRDFDETKFPPFLLILSQGWNEDSGEPPDFNQSVPGRFIHSLGTVPFRGAERRRPAFGLIKMLIELHFIRQRFSGMRKVPGLSGFNDCSVNDFYSRFYDVVHARRTKRRGRRED